MHVVLTNVCKHVALSIVNFNSTLVVLAVLSVTSLSIGMKFWKTGKIVKALSESDYHKLQRSRGNQPGPSRSLPVIVSESDSDRPLVRKKRKISYVPTPPGLESDSSQSPPTCARTSTVKMFREITSLIQDVKKQLHSVQRTKVAKEDFYLLNL